MRGKKQSSAFVIFVAIMRGSDKANMASRFFLAGPVAQKMQKTEYNKSSLTEIYL